MSIASKIGNRLDQARAIGLPRWLRGQVDVAALSGLRAIYGFDRWHARSPLSLRPYRRGIAAMVNRLAPAAVVEVGCGLGSLLPLIPAQRRVGLDLDSKVIRAARLLHGREAQFLVGSFADVPAGERFDVLIAVNWMHEVAPEALAAMLLPSLAKARHVLLDRIDPRTPLAYPHLHDYRFLDGRVEEIAADDCGEAHRRFHLYRVIG